MRPLSTDRKIAVFAVVCTCFAASVLLYTWYQDHSLSWQYIGEAQRISNALPILTVTEGRVAQLTKEMRQNESYKGELEAHLAEQINKIRLGEYTADQLNDHIASCRRFCALLLGEIFNANMHEIAKLPHEVIFFNKGDDQVGPMYRQRLQEFGKKYGNRSLYLMGRAAFTDGDKDNKMLAERRVKQVESVLRRQGFSEWQLKSTWLGYETPQLTREIADSYEINPQEYKQNLFNLNQSVVLFITPPGQYFPGVVDAMANEIDKENPTAVPAKKTAPTRPKKTVLPPADVHR